MDMSQYRELFFSETREHLNNLNQLVVELEQQPGNRETIDTLFREAHSLKGMAATMGFNRTAQLSHHLEDLLDGFRKTGVVPAATVDYLLAGIDLLEGLLDDMTAKSAERSIDEFLQRSPSTEVVLVAEADVSSPPQVNGNDDQSLPLVAVEVEPSDLVEPLANIEEPDAFQVLVSLAEGTVMASARGILVLRELEKFGELMSSKPDLDALRNGAPCQQIQAWLRTSLTKDHIEEALRKITDVAQVRFIDDRRREEVSREDAAKTIRVRTELLDQVVNLVGELITQRYLLNSAAAGRNWDELRQALGQTSRLVDDLHHHALQARLLPLESITGRLPRIVRDLSRKSGKKVTLRLTGSDVGIDRVVLEALTDPLVHLVRNAVDHGIAEEGTVTVSARREKDLVLVEVADDGNGMDSERLRSQAVEKGLLTAQQAENLSDRDALMLVCQPGFSTAAEITETSGRGVGMDVVKSAVVNLGGRLDILSAPGEGSRFQLRLPLSIAIIKILLVRCAGHPLAIPITRIDRTLGLPTAEIERSGSERVFRLGEEVLSLVSLPQLLGLPEPAVGEITFVILTELQGRKIGLEVDCFIGQREAFVKNLGFPLNHLPGLCGATVEGDGRVVFIVDPQPLLENRPLLSSN